MPQKHILTQLKDKRSRLNRKLLDVQGIEREIKADIAALDHTLKVFGYNGNPARIPTRRRYKRIFAHKELPRLIMAIQRDNPTRVRNAEIAREVILRKDWSPYDPELLADVTRRVKDVRKLRK